MWNTSREGMSTYMGLKGAECDGALALAGVENLRGADAMHYVQGGTVYPGYVDNTMMFEGVKAGDERVPESERGIARPGIKGMVEQVLRGYNVTVLTAGYSGSGKTYTTKGVEGDAGVVRQAFEMLQTRTDGAPVRARVFELYGALNNTKAVNFKEQGPCGANLFGLSVNSANLLEWRVAGSVEDVPVYHFGDWVEFEAFLTVVEHHRVIKGHVRPTPLNPSGSSRGHLFMSFEHTVRVSAAEAMPAGPHNPLAPPQEKEALEAEVASAEGQAALHREAEEEEAKDGRVARVVSITFADMAGTEDMVDIVTSMFVGSNRMTVRSWTHKWTNKVFQDLLDLGTEENTKNINMFFGSSIDFKVNTSRQQVTALVMWYLVLRQRSIDALRAFNESGTRFKSSALMDRDQVVPLDCITTAVLGPLRTKGMVELSEKQKPLLTQTWRYAADFVPHGAPQPTVEVTGQGGAKRSRVLHHLRQTYRKVVVQKASDTTPEKVEWVPSYDFVMGWGVQNSVMVVFSNPTTEGIQTVTLGVPNNSSSAVKVPPTATSATFVVPLVNRKGLSSRLNKGRLYPHQAGFMARAIMNMLLEGSVINETLNHTRLFLLARQGDWRVGATAEKKTMGLPPPGLAMTRYDGPSAKFYRNRRFALATPPVVIKDDAVLYDKFAMFDDPWLRMLFAPGTDPVGMLTVLGGLDRQTRVHRKAKFALIMQFHDMPEDCPKIASTLMFAALMTNSYEAGDVTLEAAQTQGMAVTRHTLLEAAHGFENKTNAKGDVVMWGTKGVSCLRPRHK